MARTQLNGSTRGIMKAPFSSRLVDRRIPKIARD
jgi:hypothetical protein